MAYRRKGGRSSYSSRRRGSYAAPRRATRRAPTRVRRSSGRSTRSPQTVRIILQQPVPGMVAQTANPFNGLPVRAASPERRRSL